MKLYKNYMVEIMTNTKIVYLRLSDEISQAVREQAQKTGVTAAGLMRMFILEKLREKGVQI